VVDATKAVTEQEDFDPKIIAKSSQAAAGIAEWAIAII